MALDYKKEFKCDENMNRTRRLLDLKLQEHWSHKFTRVVSQPVIIMMLSEEVVKRKQLSMVP